MAVVARSKKTICGHVTLQDLLARRRRSVEREQDRVWVFGEVCQSEVRQSKGNAGFPTRLPLYQIFRRLHMREQP
jgi:hypothetical protein